MDCTGDDVDQVGDIGCAANLLQIHTAVARYRKEHNGQMPDWLSDLVPDYLTSTTLFCPRDPKGVTRYYPDPNKPCSYTYEFSPLWIQSLQMTCRTWKTWQVKELGDLVPTVRCFHHDRVLSLTFGGRLFLSPVLWEDGPREDYRPTATTATLPPTRP